MHVLNSGHNALIAQTFLFMKAFILVIKHLYYEQVNHLHFEETFVLMGIIFLLAVIQYKVKKITI